jgi:hypothetical protein
VVSTVLLMVVLMIGDWLPVRYRLPGNRGRFGVVEVEKYYAGLIGQGPIGQ